MFFRSLFLSSRRLYKILSRIFKDVQFHWIHKDLVRKTVLETTVQVIRAHCRDLTGLQKVASSILSGGQDNEVYARLKVIDRLYYSPPDVCGKS